MTYPNNKRDRFILDPAADFPNPAHPDRLDDTMPIDPTDPNRALLANFDPAKSGSLAAEAVQASAEAHAEAVDEVKPKAKPQAKPTHQTMGLAETRKP